ncbi:hypothetical protein HELRODRAFT_105290 [Helobdella robusta]|uniref:SH2 domain-containing protein n=1 Tax=Helobdella robusta TaxID=6412 RepID=T1EDT2_HELRO|nr:hypothetical protein HELRODRAFT_105290 [Helobdella robusta]ESO12352.1 hypothetical protein HELRODRAFT_105290 [Helobdella robusta]
MLLISFIIARYFPAIQYLKDKPAGSFVIRNSATYPGAYGLTLKVSQVPDNVPLTTGKPLRYQLVRHFIIEPTAKGVQLKGSPVEPVFASLSAFVYQHTITPLSLPCQLVLPNIDGTLDVCVCSFFKSPTAFLLMLQTDCNVLYIDSLDMESLTGPDALQKALDVIFAKGSALPKTILVNIAASSQGITVTDNERRKFFRYSYPLNSITYLGLDNQEDKWKVADYDGQARACGRVFGFVAKKSVGGTDNVCHMFAELDARQNPAQTLIEFITTIMKNEGRQVTRT